MPYESGADPLSPPCPEDRTMWERVALATIFDQPAAGEPVEFEFDGDLPSPFARHPGDEEEEDDIDDDLDDEEDDDLDDLDDEDDLDDDDLDDDLDEEDMEI